MSFSKGFDRVIAAAGWPRAGGENSVRSVDHLHRDQGGAEVAHLGEQAVECGLVGDETSHPGRPVVLAGEGRIVEPRRPAVVEVTNDPDLATRGCLPSLARAAAHGLTTGWADRRA